MVTQRSKLWVISVGKHHSMYSSAVNSYSSPPGGVEKKSPTVVPPPPTGGAMNEPSATLNVCVSKVVARGRSLARLCSEV